MIRLKIVEVLRLYHHPVITNKLLFTNNDLIQTDLDSPVR